MAEAYGLEAKELSIEVAGGQVETMTQAEDRGLGVRVFRDDRMGYAFTTDLTRVALQATVDRALANAAWTGEDVHHRLPGKAAAYPRVDTLDQVIGQTSIEAKIELAKTVEATAKAADPRVKITERSAYQDSEYTVSVVNSAGVDVAYRGAYLGVYIYLVAEENGDNQTGFAMAYSRRLAGIDPVKVGREAAAKAVRMLGAKPVATRRMPVVCDPFVTTQLLGILAPGLTAEAVQKGKSLFAGKTGQMVVSPLISLIDDGCLDGGIGSAPFDGEGVPTSRTVLIGQGRLNAFLHNTYTATKAGQVSTGNGVRGSFKGTPEVGTTNFFLEAGAQSPEQLLGQISEGLYVTELMGVHTANPISGDFSLGAAGLLIENGQLTRAVRGVAIAGNLLTMLNAVDGVGNDLTFFSSRGAPTVRLKELPVSGT